MADALNEMLARLRADNDLDLAAVSADGLLVGADHTDGLDAEAVCATAGDGFLMMTALGSELDRGEPKMLTVEYEGGTVIVGPLDHGAALVMLTGTGVNLGRLRIASRRFREQYAGAVAAV
jgi:predicted regulator of Ras-like GTPase activity (Roadblock/LC7/MglB family)